jgi:undecaprenyl-diphosphatase
MGRRLGRPFLERYGHYVWLSPARLTALETFFARHGAKTVAIARFISGLRVLAAFSAGMSHMPWRTFLFYNAMGAVLWAVTIASLGYVFGQSWVALERWIGRVGLLGLATVAVGLLGIALLYQARRLKFVVPHRLLQALRYRELVLIGLTLTAIALFAKITEDVVMHESTRFDTTTLQTLHDAVPVSLAPLIVGVTTLGSVPVVLPAVLVSVGLLVTRHATRQLTALLGVTILTEVLNLLLKSLIHRQRPHLWAGLWSLTDYSFPSGHSMAAMAVYGMLAYLLGLHYPRQAWRIKLVAAGLILAIGASRMLLGVHWPTDVLGGYTAGACILCAGVYWYEGHTGLADLLKPHEKVREDA